LQYSNLAGAAVPVTKLMSLALSQSWRSPTGVMANCVMLRGFARSEKVMRGKPIEKLIDSIQESLEAMLPV